MLKKVLAASALALGGHGLDVDDRMRLVTSITWEGGVRTQSFLNLVSHGHETLLDIGGILGRCFQKLEGSGLSEFLGSLVGNCSLGVQIALVSDQ